MPTLQKLSRIALYAVAAVLISAQAHAGPYADALGRSLVAATTQADRITLVRWVCAAMSCHPEVQDLVKVSPQQKADADKAVAKLFVRLLTETCVKEAREAIKYEGNFAIEHSFNILGQVAGREAFSNPAVIRSLGDLDRHLDLEKLRKTLKPETKP